MDGSGGVQSLGSAAGTAPNWHCYWCEAPDNTHEVDCPLGQITDQAELLRRADLLEAAEGATW